MNPYRNQYTWDQERIDLAKLIVANAKQSIAAFEEVLTRNPHVLNNPDIRQVEARALRRDIKQLELLFRADDSWTHGFAAMMSLTEGNL